MLKHIYKNFIRKALASQVVGFLIYLYLSMVFVTSRRKFIFADEFNMEKFQNESSVYAFWHGRMSLMFFMRSKNKLVNIFISSHADGKIIGNVSKFFDINVIWGSSNKNPMGSVRNIFAALAKKECMAITPDGPRGPRFEINSAIAKIASKYNVPVIPMTFASSRRKIFSSWDRFILPLPFSKLALIYGKPIKIPQSLTDEGLGRINAVIKKELDDICAKADQLVSV
jgi:lysophospholipid acyltransferase (LPLAT)-like uncharacterized protein